MALAEQGLKGAAASEAAWYPGSKAAASGSAGTFDLSATAVHRANFRYPKTSHPNMIVAVSTRMAMGPNWATGVRKRCAAGGHHSGAQPLRGPRTSATGCGHWRLQEPPAFVVVQEVQVDVGRPGEFHFRPSIDVASTAARSNPKTASAMILAPAPLGCKVSPKCPAGQTIAGTNDVDGRSGLLEVRGTAIDDAQHVGISVPGVDHEEGSQSSPEITDA